MEKHTEGPWEVLTEWDAEKRVTGYMVGTGIGYGHATVARTIKVESAVGETQKANADLIAAAPDMLEALGMALRYVPEDGTHERDTREAMQDAIAKAKGES